MLLNEQRAVSVMDKYGLDALIASTKGNVAYTTGYWPVVPLTPRGHLTFSIVPRDARKSPGIIMPVSDIAPWLQCRSWVREVWPYGTYYVEAFRQLDGDEKRLKETEAELRTTRPHCANALEALIAAIEGKGLSCSRIGLDEMNITPQHVDALRREFPKASIDFAYHVFTEIRAIKTAEEVERIRASTSISEQAIREACASVKAGMTERELANTLKSVMGRQGGVPVACYVGCGTGSALTDREPTDYRVREGDWVMFDVGCRYEHYYSDIARSVVVGEPTPRQMKYYEAVRRGRAEALKMIRPGVTAGEIFRIAVECIRECGIPHFRRHSVGHSTGVEPYDPPTLEPGSCFVIEEGMVLNVETPYYELGFGGIQLEDTLLVTPGGYEYISSLPQRLRSVG